MQLQRLPKPFLACETWVLLQQWCAKSAKNKKGKAGGPKEVSMQSENTAASYHKQSKVCPSGVCSEREERRGEDGDADDRARLVLEQLHDARLLEDLDAVGCALCEVLETLELGIGDGLTEKNGVVDFEFMYYKFGRKREETRVPCRGIAHHRGVCAAGCGHRDEQPWKGRDQTYLEAS